MQGDGISGEVVPSASKMAGVRNLSSARRYPPDSGQDSKSKFFGFSGAPGRTSAHYEGWRGNARFPESRGFFSAVLYSRDLDGDLELPGIIWDNPRRGLPLVPLGSQYSVAVRHRLSVH